ncbi:MAG: response regulator [Lachnospiraceae bacterium]|nr:response regulator [Lachnospiraceae bacterium]
MLKILLVDDEPFIVQGLSMLLDWEKEGCEIVATMQNGMEALAYLRANEVDLIIADIKMPEMTGLELLETIRREQISDAYFVILSGYSDFAYAQQAIRYSCMDYVLKPIEKEALTEIIRKAANMSAKEIQRQEDSRRMERAYLARNVISLLLGKYDDMNLEYVTTHMCLSGGVRYVDIQLVDVTDPEDVEDMEMRSVQRKLYQSCSEFLKEDETHCILDVSFDGNVYDVGLIYCDYMPARYNCTEKEYFEKLLNYLSVALKQQLVMLVGKKVQDISGISKSYGAAYRLNSLLSFHDRKNIYYYEEEIQVNSDGILLCKSELDNLISAIEQNDKVRIHESVDRLYEELRRLGAMGETINLNINYLLFQLIHTATEQDDCVNQEEILHLISESAFEDGTKRGSRVHLARFACEYAEYLAQLRKNVSRGVLAMIEQEVRERFAENLTLRELGQKYFINNAYLGQVFRKKYNQSFKDYLNNYRIEQAAQLLLRTDDKIYKIAEDVGYKNTDYFINKFIAAKGCTPSKFRKQSLKTGQGEKV